MVTSSRYFSEKELACSHCGVVRMDEHFMKLLDELRVGFGPITLTSAYRCPEHPIEKRKKTGPGAHATGKAADIAVSRGDAYKLLSLVFVRAFTGIGVNQKGNSRFIHLDTITEGVRPTVWSY
jgi:zinc D-Ala-D-Ala carboxypeptidase